MLIKEPRLAAVAAAGAPLVESYWKPLMAAPATAAAVPPL